MKTTVMIYYLKRFLVRLIVVSLVFSLFDMIFSGKVEISIIEIIIAAIFLTLIETYFDKTKKERKD